MKYKVGDKVKIKKDLIINKQYGLHYFVDSMVAMRGMTLTIDKYENNSYRMKEIGYYWTDEMIECLVEENIDGELLDFALEKLDKTKDELKLEYKIKNSNDKFKLAYDKVLKLHMKYNNKLSKCMEGRDMADMFKREKLECKLNAIQEVLDIMFKILNEEGE